MIESFLNINSLFDYAVYDICGKSLSVAELSTVLPASLAQIELSRERVIPIPNDLLQDYRRFRPTPLFRARGFEGAIDTDCAIYIKDEGVTPSGNHKANSALYIAHMCMRDGVKTLITETTGNWGIALAKAANALAIETICFIDAESHKARPDRKISMEAAGASVEVVDVNSSHHDLLSLSADAAIRYTLGVKGAAYIFGSVYGYFLVPQSLVGLEAKAQLDELSVRLDIVVGSCGGGANLLGVAAPFILDCLETQYPIEILSAEAVSCPILTAGTMGLHGIDAKGYYPRLQTYGLEGLLNDGQYIGGLGSTIVASAVAHFHSRHLIKAIAFTAEEARHAGDLFLQSEGRRVALETAYQLAGIMNLCKSHRAKNILASISSVSPTEAA